MAKSNVIRLRTATATAVAALMIAVSFTVVPPSSAAVPAAGQASSTQAAGFAPQSFAPLVDQVRGAVVNVSTTEMQAGSHEGMMPQMPPGFEQFFRQFGGESQQRTSNRPVHALGSGFIIDPSGYIVTNNHVVKNGTDIKVTLTDGTTLPAKVVGTDAKTDLAVLKVDAGHSLPAVQFGDSDQAKVGDWVIAVGNPFGLGGTVTAGIVSARGRDIGEGPYDQFLQVDAAINQGNSGGPTFNTNGQVIGVNTAILSPNGGGSVGIGFAIPSDVAKGVVAQLEKGGSVERGFLGVAIQPISPDMDQALGLDSTKGALVADVTADSPAAKAGIKTGDVIVGFNGHAIGAVNELTQTVANTPVGKDASIDLLRDGKKMTLSATIAQLKDEDQTKVASADDTEGEAGQPRLGLQLSSINPEIRQRFDIPARTTGAVIVGVVPGSQADQESLAVGDVIERVNNSDVHSPKDVADAIREAAQQKRKMVAVLVRHDGHDAFMTLPLAAS